MILSFIRGHDRIVSYMVDLESYKTDFIPLDDPD